MQDDINYKNRIVTYNLLCAALVFESYLIRKDPEAKEIYDILWNTQKTLPPISESTELKNQLSRGFAKASLGPSDIKIVDTYSRDEAWKRFDENEKWTWDWKTSFNLRASNIQQSRELAETAKHSALKAIKAGSSFLAAKA